MRDSPRGDLEAAILLSATRLVLSQLEPGTRFRVASAPDSANSKSTASGDALLLGWLDATLSGPTDYGASTEQRSVAVDESEQLPKENTVRDR